MPSTLTLPKPETHAPPAAEPARRRERLARLERPLLFSGLVLVALHLLDLALAGPATSALAVLAILAVPATWALAQPRVTRPTRVALSTLAGLMTVVYGTISHGFHAVTLGPDLTDVTGLLMIAGGLALLGSAAAALAAPARAPRRAGLGWRALHVAGWAAGALVIGVFGLFAAEHSLRVTHAPRLPISESKLPIAHEQVRVTTADGDDLSAWYVPSRNGAAVLVMHGSGGNRGRVVPRIELLARHGYGVLALDVPGNGESEGRSNGLGDNAQPAVDAAVDWLERRPDVDPARIAGFGVSMGGEILLEAAAREPRLRAVVSDGATRPEDLAEVMGHEGLENALGSWVLTTSRGLAGTRPAPQLIGLMDDIAPRPVLLIAGAAVDTEVRANRRYQEAGGPTVGLWEVPGAGHTTGVRRRPAEYERRTVAFLDEALG